MLLLARITLITLVCTVGGAGVAQAVPQSGDGMASVWPHSRPAAEDGFTEVKLGFFVVDILSVDDATETFVGDFFYSLKWRDPSLVAEGGRGGSQVRLEDIWSPRLVIVNGKSVQHLLDEVAEIDDDGNVSYRQRIRGGFSCDLDLRSFPFDEQELSVSMTFIGRDATSLRLVPDRDFEGSLEDISPAGWQVESFGSSMSMEYIASQGRALPRADQRMHARRIPNFYWLKVFLPLALIVFMAWTVFWIDPRDLGPQIGVATSSVFTLIAFQLSLGDTLPRIAYTTQADEFILGSTLLVFLALGEAVATGRLARLDRDLEAQRFDRIARAIYPLVFVALAATTAI